MPENTDNAQVHIGGRIPKALFNEITEWRRQQDDLPGQAEGIRRLIQAGLEAKAAEQHPK